MDAAAAPDPELPEDDYARHVAVLLAAAGVRVRRAG
jgi:hypothetical protein